MVRQKTKELNSYKKHLETLVEERTFNLKETNEYLKEALQEVKKLQGFLPICSNCKKIRNDDGYWDQIESYISKHSDAQFSHGLCPLCAEELYGDQEWFKKS